MLWLQVAGLLVLFLLGSFFSAVETGLVAMSRHKLISLCKRIKTGKAKAIQLWLSNPNRLLTTMLIGINVVAIGASALATVTAINFAEIFNLSRELAVGVSTLFVTFIVIMFGEIIPKIVAIHNPEKVTLMLVLPLYWIDMFISPFVKIIVLISNGILRIFGKYPKREGPYVTEEEILSIVSMGEKEGVLKKSEKEMIKSILQFTDTTVREVMIPRVDIVAYPLGGSIDEMLQFIEEVEHSRIPVYKETLDDIAGVVYSKDVLRAIADGGGKEKIETILREAYFVPEVKKLSDLLTEFQKRRMHLAIVVDEYGGTVGIVTLEDLLEEIVGEIRDEYDTEEPLYRKVDSNTMRVDARIELEELESILGKNLPRGDFTTLGGYIYEVAGRVPKEGDKFTMDNLEFVVEKVVKRRVLSVRIIKL